MVYATETDVEALMAQFQIGASTRLTSTQLGTIIDMVDGEVNASLGVHAITTPFVSDGTDAQDAYAEHLKGITARGSAAYALSSLFPSENQPPAVKMLWEGYQNALKALKDSKCLPAWLQALIEMGSIDTGDSGLALSSPNETSAFFKRGQNW